ncbi:MAG: hypothetical protein HY092_02915 [Candidatus Kerfeldbacteria bacterium]|nr:hypothetical protein [Candidatus Kerfeldbacteria bacterium]
MPEVPVTRTPETLLPRPEAGPSNPEIGAEHIPIPEASPEQAAGDGQPYPRTTIVPTVPVPPSAMAPGLPAVEAILSDRLGDTYLRMDPQTQVRFKEVGEETARQIHGLLQAAKVQTQKILLLIINWLKIIPGVNQFFLEQEAKIKADKLLALHDQQKSN